MLRSRKKVLWCVGTLLVLLCCLVAWHAYPDINTLTRAAGEGDERKTRFCLLLGVNPDQPSRYGYRRHASGDTPLTAASFAGQREIVRIIIDHGVDVDLRSGGKRSPGSTPIADAAIGGNLEVCRGLLAAGADPNRLCSPHQTSKWTALDGAVAAGHPDIAALLKEHGAIRVNTCDFKAPNEELQDGHSP